MYSEPMDRDKLAALLLKGEATNAQLGGIILTLAQWLPSMITLWQGLKGGPGETTQLGSIFDESRAAGDAAMEAQPPPE
jgi:hypothetical protein